MKASRIFPLGKIAYCSGPKAPEGWWIISSRGTESYYRKLFWRIYLLEQRSSYPLILRGIDENRG